MLRRPCLRFCATLHLSQLRDVGPVHPVAVRVLESTLLYCILVLVLFTLYVFYLFCFMRIPAYTVPWGCTIWTHDVTSDWVDLGSPSSHFQDSVDTLTDGHDSQLLRHPAIDIVCRWPCLPRFRLL